MTRDRASRAPRASGRSRDRARRCRRSPARRRSGRAKSSMPSTRCHAPGSAVARRTRSCASRSRRRGPRRVSTPVWMSPSLSVARTTSVWSPGSTVDLAGPLHPGVVARHPAPARPPARRRRRAATSTPSMPVCCAQATPPTGPARPRPRRRAGYVDPRLRSSPAPARTSRARSSRRSIWSNRVTSMSTTHLRRRDVAVEPRHDHPHREAVLDRERLAVHRERQHRVAVVGQRGQRGAAVPAVLRGLQHRVGARLHAGLREQVGDRARPTTSVADQVAADLVGHAAERDPGLGELARAPGRRR